MLAFGIITTRDVVSSVKMELDTGAGLIKATSDIHRLKNIQRLKGRLYLTNSDSNIALFINGTYANTCFTINKANNLVDFEYKDDTIKNFKESFLFEVRIIP